MSFGNAQEGKGSDSKRLKSFTTQKSLEEIVEKSELCLVNLRPKSEATLQQSEAQNFDLYLPDLSFLYLIFLVP